MRIAFLGDSLTEGWPGAAYLPLVARRLPGHELLNLGRAGDGVADLLRRLPLQDPGSVDLAFVWIGVNDAVGGAWDAVGDAEAWTWEARLQRIARDYGQVLAWTEERAQDVVCVRPLVLEADGSVWAARADTLGDALAEVADATPPARVLDLRASFAQAAAAGRGPFTVDGVHFTDEGAMVVADAFADVIAGLEEASMRPRTRRSLLAAAVLAGSAAGAWSRARPRLMAWGASWDEVVRPLPGDDIVDNPVYVTTRAVTVEAPPAAVWPWLVQLGQNRGGFYSYDWLENLAGLDIHSADEIHAEWQQPTVSEDYITLDPDGAMKMTFVRVEPGRFYVLRTGAPASPRARETSSRARSSGRRRLCWSRSPGTAPGPGAHARGLGRHHGLTRGARRAAEPDAPDHGARHAPRHPRAG